MSAGSLRPHPDRLASTLAARALLPPQACEGPFQRPEPGSADARVDLKLFAWRVQQALRERGTEPARARLAELDGEDLRAGTVQDGTARGLFVAYEEALSLCAPAPPPPAEPDPQLGPAERKQLRRRRDFLVASGAARVRFMRRDGVLLVDRAHDLHLEDCIAFEDRTDEGTLDGFAPRPGERPRLFSPRFLQPVRHEQDGARDLLVLEGRLGVRARGYPCRLRFEGRKDESAVRLTVAVENGQHDHRLRIRFRGFADAARIGREGTPGFEVVRTPGGRTFVAATLVRACGRLRVGEALVPTPAAQCPGWIEHRFTLGGA